jgi:hypothetical protein
MAIVAFVLSRDGNAISAGQRYGRFGDPAVEQAA